MNKKNKVAYVSLIMSSSPGTTLKLNRYADIVKEKKIDIDFYWLTTKIDEYSKKSTNNLNIIYSKYKNPFYVRYWQAKYINNVLLKQYSKVIIRYPLFDILSLFLRNRKQIITEHHTKEIVELKLMKDFRYYSEKLFGSRWLKGFGGIIGVTNEIVDYEIERSKSKVKTCFIPNSISLNNEINQIPDYSIFSKEKLNLIMVAYFQPWHGVPEIIRGINANLELKKKYNIHFIGEMPKEYKRELSKHENIFFYGNLKYDEIVKHYKNADLGMTSYYLHLNNIKEATTLKVREYYANGIPVVFGHKDPAFSSNFKYGYYNSKFDLKEILKFAERIKGSTKKEIFEEVKPYISSEIMLKKMYDYAISI